MATTKKATTYKKSLDEVSIITLYIDYVLENNKTPLNIYSFCKQNAIEESDFYTFFGSFEAVRAAIWVQFFENTVQVINKEESYETYSNKNKLLTLYFTMFEILTLNRSYVMYALKENHLGLKNLKDLKFLRNNFKNFVNEIIESNPEKGSINLDKVTKPIFSEGAWIQFLFILKFWIEDTSKGFEKTDIIIEKSVNTVVDILDTKPLESLIDLGKFLWKERKM